MKRSTAIAVLVTAAVLVVAGNLPRLPLAAFAGSWQALLTRQVAAWPHRTHRPAVTAPRAFASSPLAAPARPTRHALVPVAPPRLLATRTPLRSGSGRFAWPSLPVQVLLPAAAGAFAGLVALATLALALRRDRRGRVWTLARRGLSPARIARSARVPQDAVRTLLTPGLGVRH